MNLPNPLRVGLWGAISYIVGYACYKLMMAVIWLFVAAAGLGLFLLALWLAVEWRLL